MSHDSDNKKKTLALFLVVFLAVAFGSFLAFYLLFNNLSKNLSVSYYSQNDGSTVRIDSRFNDFFNEDKFFPDINRLIKLNRSMNINPLVKIEDIPDKYVITVNLKQLGNDEKNVDLKIVNNIITISAKYDNKNEKGLHNSSSFYRTFTASENIDKDKITRFKNGDILTITIPKLTAPSKDKTQDKKLKDDSYNVI